MAGHFNGPTPRFTVLPSLLGGILLLQCWADLANLGSRYAEGQILATSLVMGPPLGILLVLLQALGGHVWGQLLLGDSSIRLASRLRTGKPGWARLFVAVLNTGGIWVLLGLVMLAELMLDNARHFFPGEGSVLFGVLKALLVLAYFALNGWLLSFAYPARPRWLLAALLTLVTAVLLGLGLAALVGLPLF